MSHRGSPPPCWAHMARTGVRKFSMPALPRGKGVPSAVRPETVLPLPGRGRGLWSEPSHVVAPFPMILAPLMANRTVLRELQGISQTLATKAREAAAAAIRCSKLRAISGVTLLRMSRQVTLGLMSHQPSPLTRDRSGTLILFRAWAGWDILGGILELELAGKYMDGEP